MSSQKYWIALEQSKGIGPANLKIIYDKLKSFGLSITDLFSLAPNEIKEEFAFHENIISAIDNAKKSLYRIEIDYHTLLDSGIDPIFFFEDIYPKRFHDKLNTTLPPVLYTHGNKSILKEKSAAILGEKDLSERGQTIAFLAAKELAEHKIVTISGMAKGSDIAHRSTVLNNGKTIAILPHGIFHFKIPDILQDIYNTDNILIISPFYPSEEPDKYNAFIRNRLICALSYAVYIVESVLDGGIFEAAKSAKKLSTPLFVTEYKEYPKSASANKILIEDGARSVKGRLVNKELSPNLDELIGLVKFG
ncbi:MAG: DNA-processing protein DprA [Spirochaetes bacterium]|nr:DNA-processing protein DprA [Spirochaetota bacterium]